MILSGFAATNKTGHQTVFWGCIRKSPAMRNAICHAMRAPAPAV
jgi:hypothetical protein